MRSLAFSVLMLVICAPCSSAFGQRARRPPAKPAQAAARQAASQEQQDRAEIQKLHDRDIEASMGNDVDALMRLWDDDIVAMPPGHAPVKGKIALRDYLQKDQQETAKYEVLGYNQDWQEVRICGDRAYEWGSIESRVRPYAGGAEQETAFNVMRVLKRAADGSWRVSRSIWNMQSAKSEKPGRTIEPVSPKPPELPK